MKLLNTLSSAKIIYKMHPEYLNYMKAFRLQIFDAFNTEAILEKRKLDEIKKNHPTAFKELSNLSHEISFFYRMDRNLNLDTYIEKLQANSIGGSIKKFLDFQTREQKNTELKEHSNETPPTENYSDKKLTSLIMNNSLHDLMDSFMRFRMGENFKSLGHVLLNRTKANPHSTLFKQVSIDNKSALSISCYEALCLVEKLKKFLESLSISNKYIGIYLNNCPEWYISMLSITNTQKTVVPLHLNYGSKELSYIMSITKLETVITSTASIKILINKLKETKIDREMIKLSNVILTDSDQKISKSLRELGLNVFELDSIFYDNYSSAFDSSSRLNLAQKLDLLKSKKADIFNADIENIKVKSSLDDVACILFTSGTTGIPKGVVLKHKNYLSQIASISFGVKNLDYFDFVDGDTTLSYLPAAHVLEQLNTFLALAINMEIAFTRGDKSLFVQDLKILQPSFLPVVPSVLKNIVTGIEKEVKNKPYLAQVLFQKAVDHKLDLIENGITKTPFWVNTILEPTKHAFGGRIRNILSGGSAASKELLNKVEILLNAKVRQGYGLTETLAGTALDTLSSVDLDTVGHPFGSSILKLVPLEDDANLYNLHVKGPSVTDGYFIPESEIIDKISKIPEYKHVTNILAETPFDEEGFFNTNDVVKVDAKGKISIVSRNKKSDIVKLPNGEFLSYEQLENNFTDCLDIAEIFLSLLPNSYSLNVILFVNQHIKQSDKDLIGLMDGILNQLKNQRKINTNLNFDKVRIVRNFVRDGLDDFYTPTQKKKRREFEKIWSVLEQDPSVIYMDRIIRKIKDF